MSSLVASAWLDKDLKYTLRFVSKSVFGFFASIALVVRTVEWTKGNLSFSNHGILTIKNETILDCQNICIRPNFTEANEFDCDNQELALDKRFAGQSSPIFLTIHTANIFNVIFTLFTCVPFSNVIPLHCLHLITAPSTVEKCKHRFTVVYCKIYTSTL